jgi:TP901 family phage tail tape measure protein
MSGLSKLEKLMYSIGVVDKATGPVNKIMAKINQLSSQAGGAQDQMMRGFMGAAGGAMMLVGSLNPAIAANQALGEVSSLGVAESSLQQLNDTSINFTAKYGGNAADVISASYDIQSSIAGLTGEELSSFTNASAIMAKGTKSDASTATNYLGTMYGVYQDSATAMGKTQWVEQLAGQTATAVRMFKTNGNEMSSAFTSLGAGAQSHGIEMAESMAVLGQLQATMSGSEAGTKYKAFLAGVGNAQKQLGVQLTDAQGKLLPMADVLETLHEKFGNIDTVAKSDALKKAFGSDEATGLIKLLLPQVDQLKNNINALNEQTGMQTAVDMANAQTDAWMRLSGGFNAAATALGQAVLPIIEPVVEVLGSMLRGVLWLSQEFPMLTGVVATMAVAITGLIVAMGLLNMGMGFAKFGMIGFGGVASGLSKTLAILKSSLVFARGALMSFQILAATSGGTFAALKVMMLGATSGAWAFTAALLANPLTWIVAAVILFSVFIYKYWEPIKAFMSGFWNGLVQGFAPVTAVFSALFSELSFVGDMFSWVGRKVSALAGWFMSLFAPINSTSEQLASATNAGQMFGEIVGGVFNMLLTPIKGWIMLMTKGIETVKSIAGWVSDVFGSDDVEIKATKAISQTVSTIDETGNAAAIQQVSNVVPFSQMENTLNQVTKGQPLLNAVQPTVVPFSTSDKTVKNTSVEHTAANQVANQVANKTVNHSVSQAVNVADTSNVLSYSSLENTLNQITKSQPLINTIQPAVVTTSTNDIEDKSTNIEQVKQSNQQLTAGSVRKVEKTNFFNQFAPSTHNNSNAKTDQSKRVYVDNLTIKSDDVMATTEQLMELAG